ncbi:tRNA lysidine(34) synthetase TilS, partial [bacterium]|nr:tRNA lysidine(34) synthetase TilS [bacterium]
LNHNWRGKESNDEEKKCKEFCKDITFYSEKLPVDVPHTETAARDARYDFFARCAQKFNSEVVLTAHNANDNAETLFYRMLKGTGLTGLEGIHEKRGLYYRPLLSVYRNEIENYCLENKLKPNTDSSNFDTKYARNKIRQDIFPKLREISPDFEKKLNNLAQSVIITNNIIKNQLKRLTDYSLEEFCNLSNELQATIVHHFLRDEDLDYDRKRIEEIVQFIQKNRHSKSGKTISLTTKQWLFVNSQKIEIITPQENFLPEFVIKSTGEYTLGDVIFEIEECNKTPNNFPADYENTAYISIDRIDFTLRGRKDGDTIQPLGLNGKQKLKKYLNEKKIPKHVKGKLLLLCKDNEVLWVPGYGISEKIKVVTTPTHVIKLRRGNTNE